MHVELLDLKKAKHAPKAVRNDTETGTERIYFLCQKYLRCGFALLTLEMSAGIAFLLLLTPRAEEGHVRILQCKAQCLTVTYPEFAL